MNLTVNMAKRKLSQGVQCVSFGCNSREYSITDCNRERTGINIYHKGCGTMGVPVFASENNKLTFAFNFKKNTSGKIS